MCRKDIEPEARITRTRSCRIAKWLTPLFLVMSFSLSCDCQSPTGSTLASNTTMTSSMTLVSPGGVFELGFFSGTPSNPNASVYTLAIRCAIPKAVEAKTIVWVADRSMALANVEGVTLQLSAGGSIEVYDGGVSTSNLVWTSNTLNATSAAILDTGNLVLRNSDMSIVWQSFDFPTDTLLPNQTFRADTKNIIHAWQNDGDWSPGKYILTWNSAKKIYATWQNPYLWENDTLKNEYWSSNGNFSAIMLTMDGVVRGLDAQGQWVPILSPSPDAVLPDQILRVTLDKDGNIRLYGWTALDEKWTVLWQAVASNCDIRGYCGPYAVCDLGRCSCLEEFEFVDGADQRLGCKEKTPAAYCTKKAALPDTFTRALNYDWSFNDLNYFAGVNSSYCKKQCLESCYCVAAISTIPNSEGLVESCWHKRRTLLNGKIVGYREAYVRIASSNVQSPARAPTSLVVVDRGHASTIAVTIAGASAGFMFLVVCFCGGFFLAQKLETRRLKILHVKWLEARVSVVRLTFAEIKLITANFQTQIGHGGYGTVFKGCILPNPHNLGSHEITTVAVKQLSKELTGRVERDFLNEVDNVGKIHHVNLIRLRGYCSEGSHRVLVYDYAEKGSLNASLFSREKSELPVLKWPTRFAIAIQIARGLAYLHDDCNERIIHCDIKPENILLDSSNCAKVADFGLLRSRNRNQATPQRETIQAVGTVGYVAPECQLPSTGSITNKVDVYSYGMVLLEIVSGRRNFDPSRLDAADSYFPSWAFSRLETDEFMQLVDPSLSGNVDQDEVKRALRVAFLCINERPEVRPEMGGVVQLLKGEKLISLPVPQPNILEFITFGTRRPPRSSSSYSTSGTTEVASDSLLSEEGELRNIGSRWV